MHVQDRSVEQVSPSCEWAEKTALALTATGGNGALSDPVGHITPGNVSKELCQTGKGKLTFEFAGLDEFCVLNIVS